MLIHLKEINNKYFLNDKEIIKKSYFKILHYINKKNYLRTVKKSNQKELYLIVNTNKKHKIGG